MEAPTISNHKKLESGQLETASSEGSRSGLAAAQLQRFHADRVQNLVWLNVLDFRLGSFKRFLYHQLLSVGAIEPPQDIDGRGTENQIEQGLQKCLASVITAMNAPCNSKAMNIIRKELHNYCSQRTERHQYSHFVQAANTALLLLADIQIGNSRPCPSKNDDDFLLFMVHSPNAMKSVHKGVVYERKPHIVAAFQCHIRELYNVTSNLLEAVKTALPYKDEDPLQWKRALLCVEKKVNKQRIEKKTPISYSVHSLPDDDVERTVIEDELDWERSKEERGNESEPSQSQAGLEGSNPKATGKRPADTEPTRVRKKLKNNDHQAAETVELKAPSAAFRVADYAAEALYNCFGRSHVMNLLVTDSVINVWYFDRECPIRMTGFDFIDNLPYFFLFLFALQRFSLADWGYILNVVNINDGKDIDISSYWKAPSPELNVRFCPEKGISPRIRFGLNGRATGVASGTVTVQEVTLNHRVVVKLSYQETSRVREHVFVEEAERRLKEKQYGDVCDFLPAILGYQEFHDFSSDLIREAVLVNPERLANKIPRIPYLIILPEYEPITSRTTNWTEFLNSFFALIYCHAMLWSVGIEHRDISEENLMWDTATKRPKVCDFDLSHFTGQQIPSVHVNPGTWAFMALELLTIEAMLDEVKRRYRHDLESFFAVLIWVLCRYRNGKLLPELPLEAWNRPLYLECAEKRRYSYRHLQDMETPNGLPEDLWKACVNATLLYELQQSLAVLAQHDVMFGITENTLTDEFYQSINILGPVLTYPLFQMQDGPEFVAKLRDRLPSLP